jgi:hypothetical protein
MSRGTGDYEGSPGKLMGDDVLCVAVHGDAALAGQVTFSDLDIIFQQNLSYNCQAKGFCEYFLASHFY